MYLSECKNQTMRKVTKGTTRVVFAGLSSEKFDLAVSGNKNPAKHRESRYLCRFHRIKMQNYRKKIFDPQGQERKMLDEVEEGKESAYRFDPSASSTIEGLYVKKRNTKIKYFYFLGVLILLT